MTCANVMLLGDSFAFSGSERYFLEKAVRRLGTGIELDDFELAYCDTDEIEPSREIRVVVPIGETALLRATGIKDIQKFHGYTIPSEWKIPAVPTFRPSYIQKGNQKLTGAFIHVLKKAMAIASGEEYAIRDYDLLQDPPIDRAYEYFASWISEARYMPLVCDIETKESPSVEEDEQDGISYEIVRISFSVGNGTGISMPWRAPYIALCKEMLERAHTLVFWNQAFDVPRLRVAGCKITATIVDAMWMWHWLQSDLPKALGFAAPMLLNVEPWKHLSREMPAYYSALDSAITFDCYYEMTQILEKQGRLAAFHAQCTAMIPVLEGATREGMLIDVDARKALLDEKLGKVVKERDALLWKIQGAVPPSVKAFKIYKKRMKRALQPGEQFDANADGSGTLWFPFNPSSPVQKKKLFAALGLPIPYSKRKDSETIETKHLRKYAKKFPVLMDILQYGERQKLITAYDWDLDAQHRVHPEFGFHPSTWRKSCRNPNVQTIPKRGDLAKEFRKLFIAAP